MAKKGSTFGFKERDTKPRCIVQEDRFDDSTKCAKCGHADTFAYECNKCSSVYCGGCVSYEGHGCKPWAEEEAAKAAAAKARAPSNVPSFAVCNAPGCREKLMVPMSCHYCKVAFCSRHVIESDHECAAWRASKKAMRRSAVPVHG